VVEHPGLFLRQDDHPAGTVGESFKHWRLPCPLSPMAQSHHRYFVIVGFCADTAYLPSTVVGDRPGFLPCYR